MQLKTVIICMCWLSFVNCSDSVSSDERLAVEKLQYLLSDDLYEDYMKSEQYLVRWIRAENYDFEAAKEKLKRALEWRSYNRIDNLIHEDMSHFQELYPCELKEGAVAGGPVLACPDWNVRKMMLNESWTNAKRYIASIFEKSAIMIRQLNEASPAKNITQGVFILNLEQFSVKKNVCLACMSYYYYLISTYENYYPMLLSNIYLINAPRSTILELLLVAWGEFMSPNTRNILKVYGRNEMFEYEQELKNTVNMETLSYHYGGMKLDMDSTLDSTILITN